MFGLSIEVRAGHVYVTTASADFLIDANGRWIAEYR